MKYVITLPKLTAGGTERTAATFATYLATNGHDVTILLMYRKDIFYSLHPGVKVIQPKNSSSSEGSLYYLIFVIYFLRRELRKIKPNYVLALGYITLAVISSIGLPFKIAISRRSSPSRVRYPDSWILNSAYKLARRVLSFRVDGFIAQTSKAAEVYGRIYNCPVKVIPNFLRDIQLHNATRKNQLITVGRCDVTKAQHFLLKAFSQVVAPDWNLVIVGDGPKISELMRLATELEIKDKVDFVGFQADVDRYLQESRIFVLTSIIEGFPNALLEAMATPLASISFNCEAGPSDIIINEKNGFLVEVGDIEGLTNRIQLLIDNESIRADFERKSLLLRDTHSINKIGQEYIQFIQALR